MHKHYPISYISVIYKEHYHYRKKEDHVNFAGTYYGGYYIFPFFLCFEAFHLESQTASSPKAS